MGLAKRRRRRTGMGPAREASRPCSSSPLGPRILCRHKESSQIAIDCA